MTVKLPVPPVPPIVRVVWEDACAMEHGTWVPNPEESVYTPVIFTSVGFLLHQSEAGVILTQA